MWYVGPLAKLVGGDANPFGESFFRSRKQKERRGRPPSFPLLTCSLLSFFSSIRRWRHRIHSCCLLRWCHLPLGSVPREAVYRSLERSNGVFLFISLFALLSTLSAYPALDFSRLNDSPFWGLRFQSYDLLLSQRLALQKEEGDQRNAASTRLWFAKIGFCSKVKLSRPEEITDILSGEP